MGDDAGKECAEIDDDEGIEEGESNEAGTVGINGDSAHAGPDSHKKKYLKWAVREHTPVAL